MQFVLKNTSQENQDRRNFSLGRIGAFLPEIFLNILTVKCNLIKYKITHTLNLQKAERAEISSIDYENKQMQFQLSASETK